MLETVEEGFNHIRTQVSELRYKEALGLLEDTMLGIASIENAIQPIMVELEENNIDELISDLKKGINNLLLSYESGKEENLKNVLEKTLPIFEDWKEEIDRVLLPYIVS